MSYIDENFLLNSEYSRRLYKEYAKDMPIFDYHCHLSEKQILENKPFSDLFEIWLAGDHYKWRLMRHYGVSEDYITGEKSHKEKFLAYCKTLSTAFGNPLYHWSQLELEFFFDCDLEINEKNAEKIWKHCNDYITKNKVTPQSLIEKSGVTHVYTTNELYDDLSTFEEIKKKGYKFKVCPTFRADKFINIRSEHFEEYLEKLGDIKSLTVLENRIMERLDDFIAAGCRACDICVGVINPAFGRDSAAQILEQRLDGDEAMALGYVFYEGYMVRFLMELCSRRGLAVSLHIGPTRNNNTRMFKALGADSGYDGMGDGECIHELGLLFNELDRENHLPRTVTFNLNPKMNEALMTLIGCYQSDEARGKMQFGPAWWFLDNKSGIERHLRDLVATGHIATFIGMLTDSRSFLSYQRHHYFRRLLCNFLGEMMERGEITRDIELVGNVVKDVCYNNAYNYFGG